jgi:protein-disulfide isomerase
MHVDMGQETHSIAAWRSRLDLCVTVATGIVALVLLFLAVEQVRGRFIGGPGAAAGQDPVIGRAASASLPKEPISIAGGHLLGSAAAKVALVEFADLQCPSCRKFVEDTWPQIESEFVSTGKVSMTFMHFPLAMHSFAEGDAQAAECAGRQGMFWPMAHQLFSQPTSDVARRLELAAALKIDLDGFSKCVAGDAASVKANMLEGVNLGVSATPTFFVGTLDSTGRVLVTKRLIGARPLAIFKTALAEALDRLR